MAACCMLEKKLKKITCTNVTPLTFYFAYFKVVLRRN